MKRHIALLLILALLLPTLAGCGNTTEPEITTKPAPTEPEPEPTVAPTEPTEPTAVLTPAVTQPDMTQIIILVCGGIACLALGALMGIGIKHLSDKKKSEE